MPPAPGKLFKMQAVITVLCLNFSKSGQCVKEAGLSAYFPVPLAHKYTETPGHCLSERSNWMWPVPKSNPEPALVLIIGGLALSSCGLFT